jgi:hypothetical protein
MINYNFLSCADSNGNIKEINVCPGVRPSSASTTGKVLVWYPDTKNDNLFHIVAENSKLQIIHSTLEMKIKNVSGIDAGVYIHVLSPDGVSSSDPTFTEFINWLFPAGSTFTSQSVQASGGIIINGKLACVTNVTFKSNGQILVNYFWDNNGSGGWNSKTASASDLDASSECYLKRRVNIPIAIKK